MTDLKPQCTICARHPHARDEDCTEKCNRRDADLGMTCRRCFERMGRQLDEIPELYALSAGEMHPSGGGTGGSSERSIGMRVAALDLRAGGDVLGVLGQWERDWRETYGEDPYDSGDGRANALDRYRAGRVDGIGATVVGVTAYLRTRLYLSCESHAAVDDFAKELAQVHASAVTAARTARRPGYNVDCPADRDAGICGARIRVTGEHFGGDVTCKRCGSVWDVHRLLLVAASDARSGVWLPGEDVALLLGIHVRTLQRWARDGRIKRHSNRFEVGSVRDAIAAGVTLPAHRWCLICDPVSHTVC